MQLLDALSPKKNEGLVALGPKSAEARELSGCTRNDAPTLASKFVEGVSENQGTEPIPPE